MEGENYVQVLVPLRLSWAPCYRSRGLLERGRRVTVMFARRTYPGVVWATGVQPDIDPSRIQDILKVNDELPSISPAELSFWEFLSDYYLCSPGEVFKAACPMGKIRSEQAAASVLERLRQRLAVREEALARKHKDAVRERLEAERDSLAARIGALTRVPSSMPVKPAAPRPLLMVGPGRAAEYLSRTREAVGKGLNVLVLTPEIALSEQLEARFEQEFPGIVHRLNSHITDARRRRIADDVRSYGGQIVVGTRSALFLPLSRLGLVVVENEQDVLFKQTEPVPRYNARDAAVMLARIHGAAVVLGTPSPSLESYHNVLTGKYDRLDTPGPQCPVTIVDVSVERRKNGMPGRMSRKLLEAVSRTEGPVALIRGWERTEELLDECDRLLPGRAVDIYTFAQARVSDLSQYALVAVLQADFLMDGDDFRADERALQTLALLREASGGTLLVQTARSSHPVFGAGAGLCGQLLEERRQWALPPYTRLVDVWCGSGRERIALAPDSTLQARKQEILRQARERERQSGGRLRIIIDVDPV